MTPARAARSLLGVIRRSALRVQLPAILSLVPLVATLHGIAAADLLVPQAMPDADPEQVAAARDAARRVVAVVVAVVTASCIAAALLLRGTIRSVVARLHAATESIARGDVGDRAGDGRRDELGELGRAIDVLGDRLRRLEHARRRTLACVSHELRTPLTIVQGHAFTLGRDEQEPTRARRLSLIQAEATRLASLVDDLVDAASLHAGGARLDMCELDARRLVAESVDRFADAARSAGIELHVAMPRRSCVIDADPRRLEQALGNLLGNAIRHAPRGSTIEVDLTRLADRSTRIRVANQSVPLDDAVLERIFEPFVQGEARTGSVGLGLAITRAIAEAHGGTAAIDEPAARRGDVRVDLTLPAPSRVVRAADPARRATSRRSRTALAGADA